MKKIEAIIQPFTLRRVLQALHQIQGMPGLIVSDVQCVSDECGHDQPDINSRIEVMVPDHLVEPVIAAIQKNAHTGKPGDGGIFVFPVEQFVSIRTGQREPEQGA